MIIKNLESFFQEEYRGVESSIRVSADVVKLPHDSLSVDLSDKVISILNALPHGVTNMSASIPGFVETSNNLASIELKPTQLKIITSQRSTSMSKLREISSRVHSVARLAGCAISTETSYPAWQPNMNSKVLVTCKNSFFTLFGHNPEIHMIHAGLECSSIGDIYRGIDMISIGVTIENPHSPTERMYIPSIEKIWDLLVETLKNL
jgi:dipeptidase D